MDEQDIANLDTSNAKYAPLTPSQRAKKQATFLRALGKHGVVKVACRAAGISRTTYKNWRDTDEDFKAKLPDALDERNDTLEYAAYTQAVEGVPSHVVSQGRIVYSEVPAKNADGTPKLDANGEPVMKRGKPLIERKYAPNLLQTLLKATMPEKYKDRHELTGKDGGPIQTEGLLIDTRDLTTEELALLKTIALAKKEREQ